MHEQALLTDINWRLVKLNSHDVGIGEGGKQLTMSLSLIDNKVSGYAGCNSYFGQFTLAKDQLTIGPLGMTRRFCQNSAEIEHAFTKVLSQVTSFKVTEKNLKLLDKEKVTIAVFQHKQVK
jgi:copper homeostasis protein (lipoprotein)/putative lipoprotein